LIPTDKTYEAVVIGASAGGMQALESIFGRLTADFSLAVLVVQHRHRASDDFLSKFFDDLCLLQVVEAEDKMKILPGVVYIAPPDYHLQVEMDKTLSLSVDPPVNYSRPSVDVLFETAAEAYGDSLVGVILTGANSDGSKGLARIQRFGGLALIQEPSTAAVPQMPVAAMKEVGEGTVLPLSKIAEYLNKL
jgi:two-component system chemotaxis response regulator CheB